MQRLGFVSNVRADDLTQRSTGLIMVLDLMVLGNYPGIRILTAPTWPLELVLWLAPSTKTVEQRRGEADLADQSLIMSSQVQLRESRVLVWGRHCRSDSIHGMSSHSVGPFSTSTNDRLVRVTEEDKHEGTIY